MFALSASTLAVDLFALAVIGTGLSMVFAQHHLRCWLSRARGTKPPVFAADDEEPAHYAMIIAGMMLTAFGLLIGVFTTGLELMSP